MSRAHLRQAVLTFVCAAPLAFGQTDPGPRKGAAGAGQPLSGLNSYQQAIFAQGLGAFQEVEDVSDNGLGPRFNSNSCVSCHLYPAAGGSSPQANPQMAFANSQNKIPAFITATGPVREARFVSKADGTADGGVHGLFSIMGRPDAPASCKVAQESFSNLSNISTRIPTPTFGLGLVESIPDSTLIANLAANGPAKLLMGISGRFNRNGNDGTITRFGWKAQNKSLMIFAGEAYNVEMGVSNALFPNERDDAAACSPNGSMNDNMKLDTDGLGLLDDVTSFAAFMRFLAPPARGPVSMSAAYGETVFARMGCAYCHTPALQTGVNSYGAALSNQTVRAYSDFALHNMGAGLADRISQGLATGSEFRTAPLWGAGQRLFFLHDGRATDLIQAIKAHGGESTASTLLWTLAPASDKQAVLDFLRSL